MWKVLSSLAWRIARDFSSRSGLGGVKSSRTAVLEKILESPLDSKIKPVNLKGNQPWIFIGRTDAEAGAPILWPPDVKSRFFGKDPDIGKDWGQEKKGATEDKMVRWHHHLIQWTWVWASSGSWWRTGKPGMLQSVGSQRVRHDWATEQQLLCWQADSFPLSQQGSPTDVLSSFFLKS